MVNATPSERSARAADATRAGRPGIPTATGVVFGSQGGPCDPTTNDDAGGTPASELLSDYNAHVSADRPRFRQVLQPVARSTRSRRDPRLPSPSVRRSKAGGSHRRPG